VSLMNKYRYGVFADCIPDLGTQLGISSLENLGIAVNQARYYGFEDVATWFETVQARLKRAVEEEWSVDYDNTSSD
jgi:hypothetical protein